MVKLNLSVNSYEQKPFSIHLRDVSDFTCALVKFSVIVAYAYGIFLLGLWCVYDFMFWIWYETKIMLERTYYFKILH